MTMKRITIFGGSGFLGSHLIAQLANRVPEVTVLTRREHRFKNLKVLNNVVVQEVDIQDDMALRSVLSGSDAVINLIGILNQSGEANSFVNVHANLTRKIVIAAKEAGVPRLLQVSALHADADKGSSEYLRSKGLAERHIHELAGDLAYTIFQPSVIFGPGDSFFNRFAGLLQGLPVFPLACPDAKFAPVYVGDVCNAICDSLDNPSTAGETLCLCGPEEFTLRQLVEFTRDSVGLNRLIVGLPDFAARLQARVMEWVPGKPFTRDNYLSLQTDSICAKDCEKQPTSIGAIVPGYLGQRGLRARQQASRRWARRDV
ncbi:MAG: complex I NDUFA9 subunit family protein [Gammaproteobacteria bacterium]|nr:complex I NDUFA9 subunit family protein [Gammaproteobacteria bacterium]